MTGRWQPYMYADSMADTDPTQSKFDPKAITRASRMPPSPPKKKKEGPLIDFNQHPDSYLVLPYGNTNAKPMTNKIKTFINIARWTQFTLRLLTLCGAVGVLLCGIFIQGAQDSEGYILRVPPAVDLGVCLYAVYHLLRDPKTRPAGSSASYHFFALVADCGFIPFYVFTVLMARRNADMQAGTTGRWRTMFPTDAETDKVLMSAWLTGIAVGALHLLSTFVDMYLALVFRKIAKLPPDMNPLENNLTSRRKTKHKHKNSSISASTPLTSYEEKRFSDHSSIAVDQASRPVSLIYSDFKSPEKTIPFMHTRTNSDSPYSPHTPASARQSRERHSLYSQPASAHQSRKDLNNRSDLLNRQDSDHQTLAQRKSMLTEKANIKRHSRPGSYITTASRQDVYSHPAENDTEKQEATGDLSLQRNSQQSLKQDNWFVYPEQDEEHEDDHSPAPAQRQSMFSSNANKGYATVAHYEEITSDMEDEAAEHLMPQPLQMNPPTPPPATSRQQTPSSQSLSREKSFERTYSRSSTPKTRSYGNLQPTTQAIRYSLSPSPSPSPTKSSFTPSRPQSEQTFQQYNQHQHQHQQNPPSASPNHFPSATKQYAVNAPPPVPAHNNKNTANSPFSLHKKSYTSIKRTGETGYTPQKAQSPRVISRSGVDYVNPYEFDDSDLASPVMGLGRRRDVSGKIAEEGRGGGGMTQRRVSGVAHAY
ncbi:P-loop containing nucleoside triphosphate hydrolase [Pyrenophora seminiperda CCB06]|uniref:P-loop containing nucleoside triphosphate hydrolase n=1 Tax=Pyrenophora seminiperda CCB06 TaxID=1302712 RepID=A0A3M7M6E0_9PLEO|nr:P-loop containing nucleoside triphosphate hydrolase [Pyrenophora seminiperda CCB06]